MPALRSQSITANGITLVASDGRSITITKAQLLANFATQPGTTLQKATATIAWAHGQIAAALGAEQLPLGHVTVGFDGVNLTSLSVNS